MPTSSNRRPSADSASLSSPGPESDSVDMASASVATAAPGVVGKRKTVKTVRFVLAGHPNITDIHRTVELLRVYKHKM